MAPVERNKTQWRTRPLHHSSRYCLAFETILPRTPLDSINVDARGPPTRRSSSYRAASEISTSNCSFAHHVTVQFMPLVASLAFLASRRGARQEMECRFRKDENCSLSTNYTDRAAFSASDRERQSRSQSGEEAAVREMLRVYRPSIRTDRARPADAAGGRVAARFGDAVGRSACSMSQSRP
jgi:hypothetical protein